MTRYVFFKSALLLSFIVLLPMVSRPLLAYAPAQPKLVALFPKEALSIQSSQVAKLGFMIEVSCNADLKRTLGCLKNGTFHNAIHLQIKSYNLNDEVGRMQVEMLPLTSAEQLATMRRQLEKRRANWKGLNIGQVSPIREEKVGSGIILLASYDAPCHDVNPDRPAFHEVCARAYFFNGRSEATLEFENQCSDAEVRAIIAHIFQKLEQANLLDLK